MATIGKIRRRQLVNGERISAIARSLNLAHNTVKKYLNTTGAPSYQRQRLDQPRRAVRSRPPSSNGWNTTTPSPGPSAAPPAACASAGNPRATAPLPTSCLVRARWGGRRWKWRANWRRRMASPVRRSSAPNGAD